MARIGFITTMMDDGITSCASNTSGVNTKRAVEAFGKAVASNRGTTTVAEPAVRAATPPTVMAAAILEAAAIWEVAAATAGAKGATGDNSASQSRVNRAKQFDPYKMFL